MKVEDFDYVLPERLIAQTPIEQRNQSRLLVVNRKDGTIIDKHFYDVVDYLKAGDILVRNNTRVIPARLFGVKSDTNARVEIIILHQEGDNWQTLVGNARVVKVGTHIVFQKGVLEADCVEVRDEGIRILHMIYDGIFYEVLNKLGNVPLPPYIKEKLDDKERYQTVYAKVEGSAAAPTAGLHFTDDVFKRIKEKGVDVVDITLHVGLGTFRPVSVDNVEEHIMHSEYYVISQEAADKLNAAKANGHRIIAVGTTSCRTLESVMQKHHKFVSGADSTNIFIYPGYNFLAIDGLITNFHLPKSTLIMLVSAFATKELVMKAYKHAVEEEYRFFSFGDSSIFI